MKYSQALSLVTVVGAVSASVIPNLESDRSDGLAEVFAQVGQTSVNVNNGQSTLKSDSGSNVAPLVTSETASKKIIPDSYIIVLKSNLDESQLQFHREWIKALHTEASNLLQVDSPNHEFSSPDSSSGLKDFFNIEDTLVGYSGKFLPSTVEMIRAHPDVAFIEHDSEVSASEFSTEVDAPWGLARVSHREASTLGTFNKYLYDNDGGDGVTVYVVDTGINVNHVEFEGRAKWGKTIPEDDEDVDGNGHGTHCSGTIGSKTYGIAKKAKLVAVKVLKSNGSGSMSDVVKGVEWTVKGHKEESAKGDKKFKASVANMSSGGGKSPALDLAVNAAVKAGVHFAVAAGNDNADACNYSPAAAANAVTVGASTLADDRAYFSNYGKCVDIFAPGLNISSTYIGSETATTILSGTSMASPHVCGLLAYYLSLQPAYDSEFSTKGSISPAELKKNLIAYGTPGVLSDIPEGTPNVSVYNGGGQNISEFWSKGSDEEEKAEEGKEDFLSIKRVVEAGPKVLEGIESIGHRLAQDIDDLVAAIIV